MTSKTKPVYKNISNVKRLKLIKMVIDENFTIKNASEKLKLNYYTSKYVIRVFRKDGRVGKK